VAEVVVLPWLAGRGGSGGDGVTVDEDFDGPDVAGEVRCVGVGPSECLGADLCAELAGIRYDRHNPRRSDLDLWQREITLRGKSGKPRIVKISYDAARAVNRYLHARVRHSQACGLSCGSARAAGGH
jgi:hypothetical protein